MDINNELEIETQRIENRQNQIEQELATLVEQISLYTSWAWRFVWFGGVVAIFSVSYFICKNKELGFGLNLLGDFLAGSVASIWSLAGLFFIYVAFLGQKQQLLNQQIEIMYSQLEVKFTRLELAGQKEEMIEQNKTLRQQRFESTFFQLLTLFNSIINSIDLRNRNTKEITNSGRDCFEVFYKRLNIHLNNRLERQQLRIPNNQASIEHTIAAFDVLYNADKADMSHYFRTIYHIFKFIDNSDIENKKQYSAITRAQLSSYEQILLFYNCLHSNGREKFKPLIEKYSIFKNIDTTLLINQEHLTEYSDTAYG